MEPTTSSHTSVESMKTALEMALMLGGLALVPARFVWNFGKTTYLQVKNHEGRIAAIESNAARLDANAARLESTVAEFKSQAVMVLERLETATNTKMDRLDEGQTANLQAMASLSQQVIDVSSRLERVEYSCIDKRQA